jgi:hypothetical protein
VKKFASKMFLSKQFWLLKKTEWHCSSLLLALRNSDKLLAFVIILWLTSICIKPDFCHFQLILAFFDGILVVFDRNSAFFQLALKKNCCSVIFYSSHQFRIQHNIVDWIIFTIVAVKKSKYFYTQKLYPIRNHSIKFLQSSNMKCLFCYW